MKKKVPLILAPKELQRWMREDSSSIILVDVREKEELSIASMSHSIIHFPLSESLSWSKTFSKYLTFSYK